jgi:hypothetical protein
MRFTAIGLAVALALTSTTALGGFGAGWLYNDNPENCGGLVCFLKSPHATAHVDRRQHARHRRARPIEPP